MPTLTGRRWCADCGRDAADIDASAVPDWLLSCGRTARGTVIRCLECSRAPSCAGCNYHAVADKIRITYRDGMPLCESCAGVLDTIRPPAPAPVPVVVVEPAPVAAPVPVAVVAVVEPAPVAAPVPVAVVAVVEPAPVAAPPPRLRVTQDDAGWWVDGGPVRVGPLPTREAARRMMRGAM